MPPSSSEEGEESARQRRKDEEMRYPMINRQPRREVNVPELSGGLNLRDSLTGIRDNQMTDCFNMWYKDGALRTRPTLQNTDWRVDIDKQNSKVKTFCDITYNARILFGISSVDNNGKLQILFYWQGKTDASPVFAGEICDENSTYSIDASPNYFVIEKGEILYCYTDKYKIFKCEFRKNNTWSSVSSSELYVPTLLAHGKATNNGLSYTGTMIEGYNLLTNSYKMIYSTVNFEDIEDGVTWMRYPFFSKLQDGVDTTVIAKLTTINGVVCEHKAVWTGGKELRCYENVDGETKDGLYMYVTGYHLHFSTAKGTHNIATLKKDDYVDDNLEVQVICSNNNSTNLKKVFRMTESIWFGGTANGISSGSRLFLCGNTETKEKSLVLWSALDNPLYFNENNFVYVGNKSESVVAFGRQGENLIIFKPNEMYYSYYSTSNNIDADDLINQTVVDYEASSVRFPIIQLSSGVGCDCPKTIQLCRNRLVWLNSNGKVCTLVSANQYSEMSVYIVSDMVDKRIKEYDDEKLKMATAHDLDGHYVLMIGCDAFVMDYNSYGYTHIYSYSKKEDANVLIPWYYWRFNVEGSNITFFGFRDFIFSIYDGSTEGNGQLKLCILCDEKNSSFTQEKTTCSFTTKLFDFSGGNYLKNVDRVSIGFGNNNGVPININFKTNLGCCGETVMLTDGHTSERDADYITIKNFYPTIRSVRNFGVEIECEGELVVDGLALQYKLLGSVK